MTRQLTEASQAAKLIRKELKKHGINASVKSKSYSMGSSVTVNLDDALPATYELVKSFCAKFQYGHFDGMQDMYVMDSNDDLPQAKFVFVNNSYSEEIKAAAWAYTKANYQLSEQAPETHTEWLYFEDNRMFSEVLNGNEGSFWLTRKPRKVA